MTKGYWIAHVDISDPEGYKRYQEANALPFKQYGARFLARGGESELVEGQVRSRHVIIEFPSYKAAVECYHSEQYQLAKSYRADAGVGDIVIVAGYDGIQPSDSDNA